MNRISWIAALVIVSLGNISFAAVAQQPYVWRNVAIYGGGFVTGIITHPKHPGLMYCRTDIGGAYRWDAKSGEWTPLNDWVSQREGNLLGIESLAVDPSDPNRLYVAAGTYTDSSDVTSILRSSDQGRTFQRCDMRLRMGGNDGGRPVGERLAVDPNDGRVLFFGSRDAGLWTSVDGAASWSKVESFPAIAIGKATEMVVGGGRRGGGWSWPVGISFVQFDAASGSRGSPTPVMYVGVCTRDTSLYRSADGGKTWSAVPGQPTGLRPNHVAMSADGWLVISYGDEPGPHQMDDGAVWKYHAASGQWVNITPVKPAGADSFGYSGISIDASNPNVMVCCTMCRWTKKDQVFRSTDGGKTWRGMLHKEEDGSGADAVFDYSIAPYTKDSKPHWLGDVEIDPFDPNRVMFVTGYGLWASRDALAADKGEATHWSFDDKGLEEIACLGLLSPPSGAHLISIIGDLDGYRHDDLDVPPARGRHAPIIGTNTGGDFAQNKPDIMARVGEGKPFGFYSADGSDTWTAFATTPREHGGMIAVSADGATFVWSPRRGAAHVSHDRGATWMPCSGLPASCPVIVDRVDAGTFYAFARDEGKLFISADGGASFSIRAHDLPKGDEHSQLHAAPDAKGDLWLCAGKGGLLHSTDGGATFTKLPGISDAFTIGFGKAAPGANDPALYLVATIDRITGVFRSDDAGRTWTRINDDQHQYGWIGQTIAGDPRVYGRVYLGTNGRGILYADPAEAGK